MVLAQGWIRCQKDRGRDRSGKEDSGTVAETVSGGSGRRGARTFTQVWKATEMQYQDFAPYKKAAKRYTNEHST